jgi:hypothetical protein
MSDAQVAGAALAVGSFIAALTLLIAGEVHARTAPPARHSRCGGRECDVVVRPVPRACDEWPFPVVDMIPTRPMRRPT